MKNYLKNKKVIVGLIIVAIIITGGALFSYRHKIFGTSNVATNNTKNANSNHHKKSDTGQYAGDTSLVGPRGNVPADAPNDSGFSMFAVSVPGVLSRSGQPTLQDFQWLQKNGWKSVVDFREDGEKSDQYAIDSKMPGFNNLGLKFLSIPIKDGTTPSDAQADQYLKFVTDPQNQPAHVHCAAGVGRTGIAVALYRYSVQSWPIDKAIAESSLFTKNINSSQQDWLRNWAATHSPGSYAQ